MAAATARRRRAPAAAPEGFPLRMRELSARTGLPRQALHFYIQQGLLPEGRRAGRTLAFYAEAHVERVRLIRQLQEERFLPLKAIRALLEEKDDAFTPRQRLLISEVRARVGPALRPRASRLLRADLLCRRAGVSRAELRTLESLGFLALRRDDAGRVAVAREDAYVVEVWGELKRAGFDAAHGFGVEDLALYEASVSALLQQEARLFTQRLAGARAGPAARMLERALPLIHTLLTHYHAAQVRRFLASH